LPTICRFFGITIRIYRGDHGPPHFHAVYAGDEAAIGIDSLEVLAGRLPRRALLLVVEWAMMHRPELRDNWERTERHEPAVPIAPLDEEV
jgi:hypothetical protein